eukprot:CAMPEP_0117667332 /NCGR_PEP_ID=MMETSP0804-20121206/10898_1 /TAXON_ID=1074897 /ORGANISM="Tetraselmis astigmatica, Strain CCMP880" /LENGTH=149 /DNA_ID=CAMNT_0005475027 /DNA_START=357 /DNA_END=806 /DNA_ORIENTATION=-
MCILDEGLSGGRVAPWGPSQHKDAAFVPGRDPQVLVQVLGGEPALSLSRPQPLKDLKRDRVGDPPPTFQLEEAAAEAVVERLVVLDPFQNCLNDKLVALAKCHHVLPLAAIGPRVIQQLGDTGNAACTSQHQALHGRWSLLKDVLPPRL